jgi:hypothetical protein
VSSDRTLGLHLGFSLGSLVRSETCERAERLLEQIDRLETNGPIPLYWNVSVTGMLEKQSRETERLLAGIRRRIEQGRDRVVPSGFCGVPHPLLLPGELQREIAWCYRNPWFPGLKKLFDMSPDVILPVYPDLISEETASIYSRHGFQSIAVPIPLYRLTSRPVSGRRVDFIPFADPEYTLSGAASQILIRPVLVLHPDDITAEAIVDLLSCCAKGDSLYMMVALSGCGGEEADRPGLMGTLFELLSRRRTVEFLPFSIRSEQAAPVAVLSTQLLPFMEPWRRIVDKRVWDRIENLRKKKRNSTLEIRGLLKSLSGVGPASITESSTASADSTKDGLQIVNISMTGSVTLIGSGVQAAFVQGRLSNLIDHGKPVLPGEPARSRFTLNGERATLRTESAFSFEREGQTGLRSMLATRIGRQQEVLRVTLDSYFPEEQNRLALDMTVHHPPLSCTIVQESIPLELCLCSFTEEEDLWIEVEIPERGRHREPVPHRQTVIRLYGKKFKIPKAAGTMELETAPKYKTLTDWIEFRAAKRRGEYLLWVNLGGSYLPHPAAALPAPAQDLSYSVGYTERNLDA